MHPASVRSLLAGHAVLPGDTPRLDAEVLLAHVLGKQRTYLRAWPEYQLTAAELSLFKQLLRRRMQGEPLAYLLGYREFWSLELALNSATLIPRAETEVLVEAALTQFDGKPIRALDLGTGSGAVALALASERPAWHIDAVDIEPECVAATRGNAALHKLVNVHCIESDWCRSLSGSYSLIVANPPYIDPADSHLMQGDLRFEPRQALVAADRGLAAIKQIVPQALVRLAPGGWLMLEHGYDQRAACARVFAGAGYVEVGCLQDLAGHDRVTQGRRPVEST
jgi:release factor glutamine methyltransferase